MENKINLKDGENLSQDFGEYVFSHSKDCHIIKKKNGENLIAIASMTDRKFSPAQPGVLEQAFDRQYKKPLSPSQKNSTNKEIT
ncbi:MAG: hypothetical protein M1269_13885 [Chloroflexi bacterium]|nr:hypothetical protein [Chloroflexota bacterium]